MINNQNTTLMADGANVALSNPSFGFGYGSEKENTLQDILEANNSVMIQMVDEYSSVFTTLDNADSVRFDVVAGGNTYQCSGSVHSLDALDNNTRYRIRFTVSTIVQS